jgi:hypothetical protein
VLLGQVEQMRLVCHLLGCFASRLDTAQRVVRAIFRLPPMLPLRCTPGRLPCLQVNPNR